MPQVINIDTLPDNSLPIPTMVYRCAVKEVKQEPSSKLNCMDTITCEILEPDTVVVDNQIVGCSGRTFTIGGSFKVVYSPANLKRMRTGRLLEKLGVTLSDEEWQKMEVPTTTEIEQKILTRIPAIQDLTKILPRTIFDIELHSESYPKTDTGKWNGKILKDENNQPIVAGYNIVGNLEDIKNLAEDKAPF